MALRGAPLPKSGDLELKMAEARLDSSDHEPTVGEPPPDQREHGPKVGEALLDDRASKVGEVFRDLGTRDPRAVEALRDESDHELTTSATYPHATDRASRAGEATLDPPDRKPEQGETLTSMPERNPPMDETEPDVPIRSTRTTGDVTPIEKLSSKPRCPRRRSGSARPRLPSGPTTPVHPRSP